VSIEEECVAVVQEIFQAFHGKIISYSLRTQAIALQTKLSLKNQPTQFRMFKPN